MLLRSGATTGPAAKQIPLLVPAAKPTSKDPLTVLGSAVFFEITGHLPFLALARLPSICKAWQGFSADNEAGIWRKACERFGLAAREIASLRVIERDCHMAGDDEPKVDWRALCKQHVQPEINWANGRFSDACVKNALNARVMSFVVDEEDRVCVMLLEHGVVEVLDLDTLEVLFFMPRVCPSGILSICRGLIVLRRWREDFCFHVFRIRSAIARSSNPWSLEAEVVAEARGSRLASDPEWRASSALKPQSIDPTCQNAEAAPETARGCLSYYRNIIMDEDTRACRMAVLGEGTDSERVVLAVVSNSGVYMRDVDDPEGLQEFYALPSESCSISVIDFNDNFIFLSGASQVHVLSRSSRECVMSFPPTTTSHRNTCAVAYSIDDTALAPQCADVSLSRRIRVEENRKGSVKWENYAAMSDLDIRCLREAKEARSWYEPKSGLLAAHHAGNDIICAHREGFLVVIRNFAATLEISDLDERTRSWEQRSIVIDLATSIRHISVSGTRVAVQIKRDTESRTILLDTNSLYAPLHRRDTVVGGSRSRDIPSTEGQSSLQMRLLPPVDIPQHEEITGKPQLSSTSLWSTLEKRTEIRGRSIVCRSIRGLLFGPDVGAEKVNNLVEVERESSPDNASDSDIGE